jgi:hypothetical protein
MFRLSRLGLINMAAEYGMGIWFDRTDQQGIGGIIRRTISYTAILVGQQPQKNMYSRHGS